MKYKYKYIGDGAVHFPSIGKLINKTGEIIESDEKLNHPDLEEITEVEPVKEVKSKTK